MYIMLGHKGFPNGKMGQKGVVAHGLIGGLHKSAPAHMVKTMKEMVAQAPKYGSLEKK
jgi:hypothetical protein